MCQLSQRDKKMAKSWQENVIEQLYRWLQNNPWSNSLRVRCDHVTEAKETLGLYLGPKIRGRGRTEQIAQVDILVSNEPSRKVELIVEVDPNPNPKKLLGDILAVSIADNYTPSNEYNSYKIDGTFVIFVTFLGQKVGSQKKEQFEQMEEAVNSRFELAKLGIRGVRLCHGATEQDAYASCVAIIEHEFHPDRTMDPRTDARHPTT